MLSDSGSDWRKVTVLQIAGDGSTTELPDVVQYVKHSGISWTADGLGFLYCACASPSASPHDSIPEVERQLASIMRDNETHPDFAVRRFCCPSRASACALWLATESAPSGNDQPDPRIAPLVQPPPDPPWQNTCQILPAIGAASCPAVLRCIIHHTRLLNGSHSSVQQHNVAADRPVLKTAIIRVVHWHFGQFSM